MTCFPTRPTPTGFDGAKTPLARFDSLTDEGMDRGTYCDACDLVACHSWILISVRGDEFEGS